MEQKQTLPQHWEDKYPPILSIVVMVLVAIALWQHQSWVKPLVDGVTKLVASALNVTAIAMGFLSTAQAILLSLGESRVLVALRKSGHYERLISFFSEALLTSFISALLSALLTAMRLNLGGGFRYSLIAVWAFFGLTALFSYYRASQLLSEILRLAGSSRTSKLETEAEPDHRQNDIEILEG